MQVFANEQIGAALGEVELEDRCAGEGNAIRWVMNHYRMSLKEIAIRYGGKSAASNIANYLSKSDCELMAVRNSTIRRIAEALEISASEFETLVTLRCENASSLGTSEKHLDT